MAIGEAVSNFLQSFSPYGILLLPLLLVGYFASNRYCHRLNAFPGPFLASLTDLWRFFIVWQGDAQITYRKLHDRYGDVVRLGPKTLSFAQPEAVYEIYSGKKAWKKSGFYTVQDVIRSGRIFQTIFSTTDDEYHKHLRRGASNAYALTTLLQFEPFVDSTTRTFLNQIETRWAEKSGQQGICDFATWLQYYAFDVICEITYSKRMGFLENGEDVGGLMHSIDKGLAYTVPVGQFPLLDNLLRKNPVKLWLDRLGLMKTTSRHIAFGLEQFHKRKAQLGPALYKPHALDGTPRDFLSRFMEAHYVTGSLTEQQMLAMAQTNINAGSDTTAISLRATLYYLLKNQRCYARLMTEIEEKERAGFFSDKETGLVSWSEAQQLPYLDAVIKESLRKFPAVGLCLERIVPPEGAEITGVKVPGGTIVGCNAWIIHARREVYGQDADVFRPERWLEASEEQLSAMKKYLFTFGLGSHTCIGKNISYLEMYKFVAAVLRRFKVELVNPHAEWSLHNSWFVKQRQMDVRFTRRLSFLRNQSIM